MVIFVIEPKNGIANLYKNNIFFNKLAIENVFGKREVGQIRKLDKIQQNRYTINNRNAYVRSGHKDAFAERQ